MAATFVRFGLCALVCCFASGVHAQYYGSQAYSSSLAGPSDSQAYSAGVPTWAQQSPTSQYPTTTSVRVPQLSPQVAPLPATGGRGLHAASGTTFQATPVAAPTEGGSTYFTYQPSPTVAPQHLRLQGPGVQQQIAPQYASVGGGVAPSAPTQQHVAPHFTVPQTDSFPVQDSGVFHESPFEAAVSGCTDYGCSGPGRKLFVRYEHLYWTITPPNSTLIGSTQLEGDYLRNGVTTNYQNSLNTGFIDWEWQSGHRVEFGLKDCHSGWLVGISHGRQTQSLTSNSVTFLPEEPGFPNVANSYLAGYTDANGDGFDDDINNNNFYGRHGEDLGTPNGTGVFVAPFDGTPDTPAPTDTGDLFLYLPVFAEATVRNIVELSNVEVMYTTQMNNRIDSDFELLYGFRFMYLEDYFGFNGTGGYLDATNFNVTSENQLLGLQLGARWTKCMGPIYLNAEGRFFAAANMQDNKMFGSIATNIATTSNGQNGPASMSAQSFNYVSSNNEWAPVGEFRLHAIAPINGCMAFRFGYTGFVADGISRASQKIDYVLPRFGLNQSASNETIVFNSIDFGFEIKR